MSNDTIRDRLVSMDEARNEAREEMNLRLTKMEISFHNACKQLETLNGKVDKIAYWLNGNGDPTHGLISMVHTQESRVSRLAEIIDEPGGFQSVLERLDEIEKIHAKEKADREAFTKEIYGLVKPLLSKLLVAVIIGVIILLVVSVVGWQAVVPILKGLI